MNKTLILGNYRNGVSGWAKVTQDYILALDKVTDLVCRPLILNEQADNLHPRILELEQKSSKNCDVIIQMTLPHHYTYDSNFKNIGVFFLDSDTINSNWVSHINLLDEVWVCNSSMVEAAKKSGVTCNIELVQPPVNTEKFERTYEPLKGLEEKLAGDFSFLFVGELSRRKNLASVLRAWHLEFSTNEPVSLVIKATKFGCTQAQIHEIVTKMSEELKLNIKLYPKTTDYKSEIVITERLSDEDMCGLYSAVDCMASASYAESWGDCIINAMGLGTLVIANKVGGPADYLTGLNEYDLSENYWEHDANSLVIDRWHQIEDGVVGMTEGFDFLFTGLENWNAPSVTELRRLMRMAYEMKSKDRKILRNNALNTVYEMSYESFGKRVKGLLS